MDITYNKVDETALPISTNRVSANEYNQIAGSLMHIINTSTLTPDAQNNAQLLNAIKTLVKDFPYIVETYHNSTEWYRKWSDGWCEQGGYASTTAGTITVDLLVSYASTDYSVFVAHSDTASVGTARYFSIGDRTTSSFKIRRNADGTFSVCWEAKGYIS